MAQKIKCEEYVIITDIYTGNNRKNHLEGTIQITNQSPSVRRRSKCCYLFPYSKGIYNNVPCDGGSLISDKNDIMNIFIKDQDQDKYVNQVVMGNFLSDNIEHDRIDYYKKPLKTDEILHEHNFSYLNEKKFQEFKEKLDRFHIELISIKNDLYNVLEIVYNKNYIIRTECYVNQYTFNINSKAEFTAGYNQTVGEMITPSYIITDCKKEIDWSKKDQKYANFKPYLTVTKSTNMINKYEGIDGKNCFDYILSFRVG